MGGQEHRSTDQGTSAHDSNNDKNDCDTRSGKSTSESNGNTDPDPHPSPKHNPYPSLNPNPNPSLEEREEVVRRAILELSIHNAELQAVDLKATPDCGLVLGLKLRGVELKPTES